MLQLMLEPATFCLQGVPSRQNRPGGLLPAWGRLLWPHLGTPCQTIARQVPLQHIQILLCLNTVGNSPLEARSSPPHLSTQHDLLTRSHCSQIVLQTCCRILLFRCQQRCWLPALFICAKCVASLGLWLLQSQTCSYGSKRPWVYTH